MRWRRLRADLSVKLFEVIEEKLDADVELPAESCIGMRAPMACGMISVVFRTIGLAVRAHLVTVQLSDCAMSAATTGQRATQNVVDSDLAGFSAYAAANPIVFPYGWLENC